MIGYGLAGSVFHAPLIAAAAGFSLTSVVTGDEGRAAAVRARYPGTRVLADVDDLWRDPAGHDLVVIAGPNRAHLPLALAAIETGLPVVVDKPVTATSAEARRLRDAAAARGLLASVFHNRRWDGDALTIRRLLAEGALGRVHRLESRFERWRPEVTEDAWREDPDPVEAGGLLYDLGSHLIDQALTFFGPAQAVYAELSVVRAEARVDDDVFLALTHEGGVRSHLWASAVAADSGPRFRVLGSAGSYVKRGMDVQEAALRDGAEPGGPRWGAEPETDWGRLGTPDGTRPVPTEPGAYQDYYAELREALRHGRPPPVTIDQAIDVLDVIEAARRSAPIGRALPILPK